MLNVFIKEYADQFPICPALPGRIYIKKNMLYDSQSDNSPKQTKMTQKLTTISHRTAFNNDQSTYGIFSYKWPINNKCKTIQTIKLTA